MRGKKKELTTEEKLKIERENQIKNIEKKLQNLNKPSYFFDIGDKVKLGGFEEVIVTEIFYNGMLYGLRCVDKRGEENYRIVNWVDVRPLGSGDTSFSKNKNIRLDYLSKDIRQLINIFYNSGIDLAPDYQRDYVWDKKDKEFLIDSIFKNIDIGKFVLIKLSDFEWLKRNKSYEILDGKQRLSTIIKFYENKFSYKGVYYNDLSKEDQRTFKNHTIAVAEVDEIDKKDILKYFLFLNRTGKVMDKEHLDKIEKMLKELNMRGE
jgi:hypothetical protein